MVASFRFLLTTELDLGDTLHRSRSLVMVGTLLLGILTALDANARTPIRHQLSDVTPSTAEVLDENCARFAMTFSGTKRWIVKRFKQSGMPVEFTTTVDLPGVYSQNAVLGTRAQPWDSVNVSQIGPAIHVCYLSPRAKPMQSGT